MASVPKTDPIRRNARVGPLILPASGRPGAPPPWPIPGPQIPAEMLAWEQLWATPQAVVWEKLGWTRTVARYCRVMIEAERDDASAAMLAQCSVLEDRLGLTPKAMRALLWQVAPDEVAERRDERSESVRERLRAVDSA